MAEVRHSPAAGPDATTASAELASVTCGDRLAAPPRWLMTWDYSPGGRLSPAAGAAGLVTGSSLLSPDAAITTGSAHRRRRQQATRGFPRSSLNVIHRSAAAQACLSPVMKEPESPGTGRTPEVRK